MILFEIKRAVYLRNNKRQLFRIVLKRSMGHDRLNLGRSKKIEIQSSGEELNVSFSKIRSYQVVLLWSYFYFRSVELGNVYEAHNFGSQGF